MNQRDFDELFQSLADEYKLTRAEISVTGLLLQGQTQAAIARHLKITHNTVKGYVKTIYSKLHVHNRNEFFRAFMEFRAPPPMNVHSGILSPPKWGLPGENSENNLNSVIRQRSSPWPVACPIAG